MSRPWTIYVTVDVLHCDTPHLKEAKALLEELVSKQCKLARSETVHE